MPSFRLKCLPNGAVVVPLLQIGRCSEWAMGSNTDFSYVLAMFLGVSHTFE